MRRLYLKEENFGRGITVACTGILFQISSMRHLWTYVFHSFSSWLVEGLVTALNNCNFKYIFIFHFSQLSHTLLCTKLFPCSFLFFGGGEGSASLWKKWFQNSTHLLFWTYMYFCNVLKNQYKKANTSINVAIALWLKQLFILIISSSSSFTYP